MKQHFILGVQWGRFQALPNDVQEYAQLSKMAIEFGLQVPEASVLAADANPPADWHMSSDTYFRMGTLSFALFLLWVGSSRNTPACIDATTTAANKLRSHFVTTGSPVSVLDTYLVDLRLNAMHAFSTYIAAMTVSE